MLFRDRVLFCSIPTQISSDIEMIMNWSSNVTTLKFKEKVFHSFLSRLLLVPEHHSVVSLFMAAEHLNQHL